MPIHGTSIPVSLAVVILAYVPLNDFLRKRVAIRMNRPGALQDYQSNNKTSLFTNRHAGMEAYLILDTSGLSTDGDIEPYVTSC